MTNHDRESRLDYYRTEFLKLRSALHDRTTDLPAVPALTPQVRKMLDARHHVGVLHVEVANLDVVESLYGWQVFDEVLEVVAEVLRAELAGTLPSGSVLGINGVGGDHFAVFVPEQPSGDEVEMAWLAELATRIRSDLESAFDTDGFTGLSPKLVIETGHALLSEDPFYRFERRIHAAVDEARTHSTRREKLRERSWGEELKRIIRDANVSTVFQPVVDLVTREI
ncbi:MAG: GGDEF domain-containing protein, partial [Acidobacteriota bacterium]|nr:GGDEF domain-containing protein [Acidobacteriota bacterium]